jgi:hypothetical protein
MRRLGRVILREFLGEVRFYSFKLILKVSEVVLVPPGRLFLATGKNRDSARGLGGRLLAHELSVPFSHEYSARSLRLAGRAVTT